MVYLVRGKYIISIIMEDSRDMNGMIIYYGFIKRGWRENPLQKLEVLMGTSTINSNLMVDCLLPCLISG